MSGEGLPGVQRGRFFRLLRRSVRFQRVGWDAYLYLAHRVTGVVLIAYLFLHLYVLSSVLSGPEAFDRIMAFFENPAIKAMELLLVVAVLFHTLNGLRLIAIHVVPFWRSRAVAWGVALVPVLVGVLSIGLFLR